MLELCKNMDENKDEDDFQEETIKEFLKPRICLERLRKDYFRWLEKHFIKIRKIFQFSKPKKMTCANCWLWFALCVIYYGISLSSTSLAGNPFLNNG